MSLTPNLTYASSLFVLFQMMSTVDLATNFVQLALLEDQISLPG